MKKPSISFKKLPYVLSKVEKKVIIILGIAAIIAAGFWLYQAYLDKTEVVPKNGGTYTEGVLGQPKFINPIIAQQNTVDSDLVNLIYSSLFKYNLNNEIQPDLAEKYEVSEDQLTVTVTLKEGIKWQDGEDFSADDVIFTIQSIQNPNLQSPLKSVFENVSAQKTDERTIVFTLSEPYTPFVSTLTFGILPKHLWEKVEPGNIPLTELNLQPVGTGPFTFKEFKKDKLGEIKSYTLERNGDYFGDKPHLDEIVFKFYPIKESLVEALTLDEIEGLSYDSETAEAVFSTTEFRKYDFSLPRYNAVFFNFSNNEILEYKKVREALQKSINWEDFQNILPPGATLVNGPILEKFTGYDDDIDRAEFNIEQANQLLDEAGWNEKNENGIRTNEDNKLEFKLIVSDFPEHQTVADFLVESWKQLGIDASWEALSPADVQSRIRERDYDAILFGQVTGHDPDPYPFWHSTQQTDPGLNLTSLENEEIDTLIEEARQITNEDERIEKYKTFQQKLAEENIALFLYSPAYHYAVDSKVKGIAEGVITNPAERFTDVTNWYIKTKRVKKDNKN